MPLFVPGQKGAPFALVALGVAGDDRTLPDLQPRLPDGIHLRWAFENTPDSRRGFPWYGFYLLRRLSLTTSGQTTCVANQFSTQGLQPGTLPSPDLSVLLGTFHSDQNLRLTDDFPPTGTVELDLAGRTFVSFKMDATTPKRRVDVTLGFVSDFPPIGGSSGGGPTGGGGTGGGLGTAGGADSSCACGCGQAAMQPFVDRVIALGNGKYRATFGYRNGGSTPVAVAVGHDNRFFPDPADRGQPTLFLPGTHSGAFSVDFDGRPIAWTLTAITVTASAADATAPGTGTGTGTGTPSPSDGIIVTALCAGVTMVTRVASGRAGEVVTLPLEFEAIDEVRLTSGPARLINLCAVLTSDGAGQNWAPVPGFPGPGPQTGPSAPQAMFLPVQHNSYPLQKGAPDINDSKSRALPRIRYGFPSTQDPTKVDTTPWTQGTAFSDLFDALVNIVKNGPPAITDFIETIQAQPDPSDPTATPPQVADQSTLDLLLAAAVNPAAAQMLGLYWIDEQTVPGSSYDYMLIGDYTNVANGNVAAIQSLVAANNFTNFDAYQRIGVISGASPSLAPPQNARGYALPATAVPADAPGDAAGYVGLLWDVPSPDNGSDKIDPTGAILFHIWRRAFGRSLPASAPDAPETYSLITSLPIAPGTPRTDDASDPTTFLTGWPQFNLFAVDGPLVEGWYGYRLSGIDLFGRYSPRSGAAPSLPITLHDIPSTGTFDPAVHLVDTTPPPAPVEVRAWALDPGDTLVFQDDTYNKWRLANPSALGLRVRWTWTGKELKQAPDTKEFRIYVNPGSSMTDANIAASWQQRIAVVRIDECIVSELIAPARTGAAVSLTGLQATAAGAVVTLADGTPLDGVVAMVADGVELELAAATNTRKRFRVLQIDPVARAVTVDQAPQLPSATSSAWTLTPAEIRGQSATASGADVTLADSPPLDGLATYALELELTAATGGRTRFNVTKIDVAAKKVTVDPAPQLAGASAWTLGVRERTYELFLPGTTLATPAPTFALPVPPSLTTPIVYAMVGVSAADDKDRADVRPSPAPLTPRFGNEGAVGGPMTVYQVWRAQPAPPAALFAEDKLLATRADFNSKSFFMVHFDKQAHLSTDVFRALDETLFLVDAQNTTRNAEAGAITAATLGWFTPQNQPDNARRTAALNQITAASPPDYGKLSNDALRILASLPSNAPAFSRITNPPLRSENPANDDQVGPNELPPPYTPQANRGSYLDTLDGRTTNRYFYRAAHVDDAHNQGLMGPSTPPVYLPIATVPAPLVVVDATSGENVVTLSWRSSADPDVAEYRIYRSDTEPGVRRLLASDRISTVAEPKPPESRDTIVKTVPPLPADGGKRFFYAITAATAASAGTASRESGPSTVIALSAFEDVRPAPPVWGPAQPQGTALKLTWTTTATLLRNFLVQRRLPPATDWQSISGWLPATARSFLDQTRAAGVQYEYRLLVIDQNGRRNNQDSILSI